MLDSLRYKIIERQLIKFLDEVESYPERYTFLSYSNHLLKFIDRIDNLSEEFDISESLEQRIKKTNDFVAIRYFVDRITLNSDINNRPNLSVEEATKKIVSLLKKSIKAFDEDNEDVGHSLMVDASNLKVSLSESFVETGEYLEAYDQMQTSRMNYYHRKTKAMRFPPTPFSLLDEAKSTPKNTAYGLLLLIYVNNLPYNDGAVDLPNYWKRSYRLNTEDMIQTMLLENFIYVDDGRIKHTFAGKELAAEWIWLKKIHISPVLAYELVNDYLNLSQERLNEFLPDSEWTIYDALIDIYTAKNIVAKKRGEPYDLDEFRGRAIEKVRQDFGMHPIYWPSESKVYSIVRQLYPHEKIQRRCRPKWLQGLEIDIYLPDMKIGIEYQGEQHYKPIKHWGGEETLRKTQMRDAKKRKLCHDNGIALVYINYYDDITEELVKCKINEAIGGIL